MDELRNNIINQLNYFKDRWSYLSDSSNDCLNSRVTAMQIAINIVNREFDKVSSPDKTLYQQIMSEMSVNQMAMQRIKEDKDFFYTTDGTSFDKKSPTAFTDAVRHEVNLLNQPIKRG